MFFLKNIQYVCFKIIQHIFLKIIPHVFFKIIQHVFLRHKQETLIDFSIPDAGFIGQYINVLLTLLMY